MLRTKPVPGIALGRLCRLGEMHYPVLGDKGPGASCLSAKISLRLAGRVIALAQMVEHAVQAA
jgi:hypothetical protein